MKNKGYYFVPTVNDECMWRLGLHRTRKDAELEIRTYAAMKRLVTGCRLGVRQVRVHVMEETARQKELHTIKPDNNFTA